MTAAEITLTGQDAIDFAQAYGLTTVDVQVREIGLASRLRPIKLADVGPTQVGDLVLDLADLSDKCRSALGRLRHSQPLPSVAARAREYLEHLGLVQEHTAGQIEATRRARGYVADPSTFEV